MICQIHLEGLVVPDPWMVTTSPSPAANLMDARKIAATWVIFMIDDVRFDIMEEGRSSREDFKL